MKYIIFKLFSALNLIFLYLIFTLFIRIKHNTLTTKLIENNDGLFAALYFISFFLCLLSLYFFAEEVIKNDRELLEINFLTEIKKGKHHFYSLVFDFFFEYLKFFFIKLTYLVMKYEKYSLYVLLAGIILPRFIIIICLLTEIYQGHFYNYYYSLLLLIFTIILNIIIYILKNMGPKHLAKLERIIKTTEVATLEKINPDTLEEETEITYEFTFIDEYAHLDFPHFWDNIYLPIVYISDFMEVNFLPKYKKIRVFTCFLYFLIHWLSWCYFIFIL